MKWLKYSLLIIAATCSHVSFAGVIVGGTRVIYDANKKESSISVKNPDKIPYLIQSWVDNASETDVSKVPFIITPPLFRLDPSKENLLRIISSTHAAKSDRESIYWLNVKSIPSSTQSDLNQLQITVKTRIKLFYRPASLSAMKPEEAFETVKFSKNGATIEANNPSPFYISFYSVKADGVEIKNPGMIPPKSSIKWDVGSAKNITWQAINDYGGVTPARTINL